MTIYQIALVVMAGFASGAISTLAGGASIVSLPLLLAAGYSPLAAIASNTVALVPGLFLSVIMDRDQLPTMGRHIVLLTVTTIVVRRPVPCC
jgi:uncharacterized membrane protein YfcA